VIRRALYKFKRSVRRAPYYWLTFAGLLLVVFVLTDRYVPRQHLPWRSLDIAAPTGFATDIQLTRLALSPSSSCAQMINSVPDYKTREANRHRPEGVCGWDIAREIDQSEAARLKPGNVTMQCPLAVGMYIWMREMDKAANMHLGTGVKSIEHFGAYSCRSIAGTSKPSEHSYANAFDISGFVLDDGRSISVLRDWNGSLDRRKFLREARRQACKIFRVTLSPDFNSDHADHFHVDMGPSRSCR